MPSREIEVGMSVQKGFLAILTDGPAYGSQLQSELLARAAQRSQLNAGQVYSTLERLAEQGLIRSAGLTDDGLPLWELTDEGRRLAEEWLRTGPRQPAGDWDEMQDQVLVAASLQSGDPLAIIADYERAFRSQLGVRSAAGASTAATFALRAVELGAEAALSWLEAVRAALTANADLFAQPRNQIRPKRGRRPAKSQPTPKS